MFFFFHIQRYRMSFTDVLLGRQQHTLAVDMNLKKKHSTQTSNQFPLNETVLHFPLPV